MSIKCPFAGFKSSPKFECKVSALLHSMGRLRSQLQILDYPKKLVRDKQTSFFHSDVSDERKSFIKLVPGRSWKPVKINGCIREPLLKGMNQYSRPP
jgi:hypothetical protein